jgi:hypothetical protein
VYQSAHTRTSSGLDDALGPCHVDRVEVPRACRVDHRGAVHHGLDGLDRGRHGRWVAHIAADDLDVRNDRPGLYARLHQGAHIVARTKEIGDEPTADPPGGACYEDLGHVK